ncbi:tetratricopeptide repeat protein [Paraburkholderia jirisanensis]
MPDQSIHEPTGAHSPQSLLALCAAGRFAEALSLIEAQSASGAPLDSQTFDLAALCALSLGQTAAAEAWWRRAIDAWPEASDAYNHLGKLLKGQGRLQEAEAVYRRLLAMRPASAEALSNLGAVLFDLQRIAEAEALWREALRVRPDFPEALHNLGRALHAQGRLGEAEQAYRNALLRLPDSIEIHVNLGNVLQQQGRLADAETAYRAALALRPDIAAVHYNLGHLLKMQGRLTQAEAAYRDTLALQPDYPMAAFSLAVVLLQTGRYAQAWPLYESRFEQPGTIYHQSASLLGCPRWRGEPLAGKRLLVWQEDGLGDMIQFGRYLPLLKARGVAHLAFACQTPLQRLFDAVDGVDEVLSHEAAFPHASGYDYWLSPMSAPALMDTTLDTIAPPLRLRPDSALLERWGAQLAALPQGRKVGLVWRGNSRHHNDAHRSLPSLACLAPLWQVPGLSFVSLQKGDGESEAHPPPAEQPLLHLGSAVTDLADTAAIVAQLDLVISVDTSTVHLAASLGVPCWVLLPAHDPDWRWMSERTDSPWYPGALRLFRRASHDGDWHATIARVCDACRETVSAS